MTKTYKFSQMTFFITELCPGSYKVEVKNWADKLIARFSSKSQQAFERCVDAENRLPWLQPKEDFELLLKARKKFLTEYKQWAKRFKNRQMLINDDYIY